MNRFLVFSLILLYFETESFFSEHLIVQIRLIMIQKYNLLSPNNKEKEKFAINSDFDMHPPLLLFCTNYASK